MINGKAIYHFDFDCVLTVNNLTKELLWGVSKERHTANQKLIKDHTHGPPIHRFSVTLPQDDLRSNILWSATHLNTMMTGKEGEKED